MLTQHELMCLVSLMDHRGPNETLSWEDLCCKLLSPHFHFMWLEVPLFNKQNTIDRIKLI